MPIRLIRLPLSVEVGLVGKEGFVGLPLVAGFRTSPTRAVAQIEGTAFRVDGETLMLILRQSPSLERLLQKASQIMAMQVTQIAACNRLHEVDERLARWLLMSADRVGSNSVPLTQEFLAQMLGTRRSSVKKNGRAIQSSFCVATHICETFRVPTTKFKRDNNWFHGRHS